MAGFNPLADFDSERIISMRNLLAAIAVLMFVALAAGADNPKAPQDQKTPEKTAAAPTLKAGDVAPALTVSKWFQGDDVKRFEPGHVYVIEFWATWCGPCIAFMPDLAELQAQYRDKDLTCIGVTVRDPNNTAEMVSAFVKKRGPKLKYTFAYADEHATWDAWMTAANKHAIPCSFVVDKSGRIAYIGNPTYLGIVAPMVLSGMMSAQTISDEMKKVSQEFAVVSDALSTALGPAIIRLA